jgi:hypothetical protein
LRLVADARIFTKTAMKMIMAAAGVLLLVCVIVNIAVRRRLKVTGPDFGSVSERWLLINRTDDQ